MIEERYFENHKFENIKLEAQTLVDYQFIDCEFNHCFFEECVLQSCSFRSCKFYKTSIICLQGKYSQLKYSEFTKCNLIGLHWNDLLPAGKIAEPIHKLTDCVLKYNSFIDMSLMKFSFSGNSILESVFDGCNLRECNFKGCRLDSTLFTKCDIRKADFRDSMGYQIDISSNKMKDAKFSFPEVVNLLNGLGIKID